MVAQQSLLKAGAGVLALAGMIGKINFDKTSKAKNKAKEKSAAKVKEIKQNKQLIENRKTEIAGQKPDVPAPLEPAIFKLENVSATNIPLTPEVEKLQEVKEASGRINAGGISKEEQQAKWEAMEQKMAQEKANRRVGGAHAASVAQNRYEKYWGDPSTGKSPADNYKDWIKGNWQNFGLHNAAAEDDLYKGYNSWKKVANEESLVNFANGFENIEADQRNKTVQATFDIYDSLLAKSKNKELVELAKETGSFGRDAFSEWVNSYNEASPDKITWLQEQLGKAYDVLIDEDPEAIANWKADLKQGKVPMIESIPDKVLEIMELSHQGLSDEEIFASKQPETKQEPAKRNYFVWDEAAAQEEPDEENIDLDKFKQTDTNRGTFYF